MSKGWLKLHRKIEEHWLWTDKPFSKGQAWIDLLLMANHEDVKSFHEGKPVVYKTGTVSRSILYIADRWGWDRKKVKRFLSVLESDGMVTMNSTTHGTTITLVNYSNFQDSGSTDGTTDGTTTPQPMVQPLPINKNYKELKELKEINNSVGEAKRFTPPTVEEVAAYCQKRGNNIDAEYFVSYYASQKWKKANGNALSNWKQAVITWEHRDKEKKQTRIDAHKEKVKNTKFNNFPQRTYDYEELERQLFNR